MPAVAAGEERMHHVRHWYRSDDHLRLTLVFLALGTVACIVPAQADTFYHLASGRAMWERGALLDREVFSHTSYGFEHPNHWWLAQLLFFAIHRAAGPVGLSVFAGACALVAVIASWRLTIGAAGRRLLFLLAFLVTTPAWSVRPQVLSMLLFMLVLHLALRGRLLWIPAVMVLWANVHGLVLFGIVVTVAVAVEAFAYSRTRRWHAVAVVAASLLAPVVSPQGLEYWGWMLSTVADARALDIVEFRPAWRAGRDALGLVALAAVFLAAVARAAPSFGSRPAQDRILVITSFVLLLAAAASVRNTAFAALAALPAVARLLPASQPVAGRAAPSAAYVIATLAALVAATVVSNRWRDGGAPMGWKPMSADVVAAVRECPGPLYNGFDDGGTLIWFVPEQRVFIDGRTDAYPMDFLRSAVARERAGDYRSLFAQYRIRCAVVQRRSPVGRALTAAGVTPRAADARWLVADAVAVPATAVTAGG